jgi:hypothetical protein
VSESEQGAFLVGITDTSASKQAALRWPTSPGLSWEASRDGVQYAKSGALTIGTVGRRVDGSVWYSVDAVSTRWIAKGHGEVKTFRSAKRAVERAWAAWLAEAGLQPIAPASARRTTP